MPGANPALCFGTNDSQKQFDIVANMVSANKLGVEMEVASYTRNALPEPDEDSVSAAAPLRLLSKPHESGCTSGYPTSSCTCRPRAIIRGHSTL